MVCNNVLDLEKGDLGVHISRGIHHGIAICMGKGKNANDYMETLQHEAIHAVQFCANPYAKKSYFEHSENVREAKEDGFFSEIDDHVRNKYEEEDYEIEFEAYLFEKRDVTEDVPLWIEEDCILSEGNAPDRFFDE